MSKDNLSSILYDVGYSLRGVPDSTDREAVYVPLDGSVNYDTLNDHFKEVIGERKGVDPENVNLIISRKAENVIV